MAEDPTQQGMAPDHRSAASFSPLDDDAPAEAPAKPTRRLRLLSIRALVILVVASVVIHGVGLTWYYFAQVRNGADDGKEIALGPYSYSADPVERSPIVSATFSLHIALIDDLARPARQALAQRQFRVKQDVEELLRQAHGGDFADPALGELKRRLQERINETLGIRAIADVIITDLEIDRKTPEANTPGETASAGVWRAGPG